MERMTAIEVYEQKRERIRKFNLVSDLFAAKVFEDLTACQELCRILMRNPNLQLKDVKTQYVIRNLGGAFCTARYPGRRTYRKSD